MSDPFSPPKHEVSIAGLSVMLAMPVNRDLPWQVALSLMETQDVCYARGVPFELQFQVGCSMVEMARTRIVWEFLKGGKNRLFWVDSDIQWKAADFIKVLALSTQMEVVGGIYPSKEDPPVFRWDVLDQGNIQSNEYGCLSVGGMGMGFTCVRREVIEQLSERAPKLTFPGTPEPIPHVFRVDHLDGNFRGEDMAFFADVRALGYEVWLDPTITLSHVGAKAYTASISNFLVEQKEAA